MSDAPKTSRRGLILGVGALAAIAAGWQVFGVGGRRLNFAPLPGLNGWQQAQSGAITAPGGNATSSVLLGIDGDSVDLLPANKICATLYQNTDPGVQVAVFSDFFCPNCRTLDTRLAARNDLSITWHQLPLLGPSSELVAQALMAADRQGGYVAMRDQLLSRPFRPMLQNFLEAAIEAGLNAELLGHEMYRSDVRRRLRTSRAAAETLSVWGTPAFTIGQTLVLGAITDAQLDRLVEMERDTVCG